MQEGLEQVARKIVVGLRQVAGDVGEQIADRINGHAVELAQAIGDSADLLAAREFVATAVRQHGHLGGAYTIDMPDDIDDVIGTPAYLLRQLESGALDQSVPVQAAFKLIQKGRELAEADRLADMTRPPTRQAYLAPEHLTITVAGQNRTAVAGAADLLRNLFPTWWPPRAGTPLDPRIIRIDEDGRRFDVRNEVFLDDGAEG